jgi:hypothetical protein
MRVERELFQLANRPLARLHYPFHSQVPLFLISTNVNSIKRFQVAVQHIFRYTNKDTSNVAATELGSQLPCTSKKCCQAAFCASGVQVEKRGVGHSTADSEIKLISRLGSIISASVSEDLGFETPPGYKVLGCYIARLLHKN